MSPVALDEERLRVIRERLKYRKDPKSNLSYEELDDWMDYYEDDVSFLIEALDGIMRRVGPIDNLYDVNGMDDLMSRLPLCYGDHPMYGCSRELVWFMRPWPQKETVLGESSGEAKRA